MTIRNLGTASTLIDLARLILSLPEDVQELKWYGFDDESLIIQDNYEMYDLGYIENTSKGEE